MCEPTLSCRGGAGLLTITSAVAIMLTSGPALAQNAPTCPENWVFSQEPYDPATAWTANPSDVFAHRRYFELYDVEAGVREIHWWGILQIADTGIECFENPIEFELSFWGDAGNRPYPFPVYTHQASVVGVDTGYRYNGFALYEYCVDLGIFFGGPHAWIAIQAVCPCDPDCWFWWMGSPDGDGFGWHEHPYGEGENTFDPAICLMPEPVPPPTMELDGAFDPLAPVPSPVGPWHELWPAYCTDWSCVDWIDNGNGYLDVCDYLLVGTPPDPEPTWWHVEDVTVTAFFDETVPPMPGGPPVLDWDGALPPQDDPFFPLGPWHEVWPEYCTGWDCVEWVDSQENHILDFCDWLVFEDPMGLPTWMHVSSVGTDITVMREDPPDPPRKWLDNPDLDPFEPIPEPRGPWHELWPTFCRDWTLTDWVDNGSGVLDACDYIQLDDPPSAPTWWHVETVTVTMPVTPNLPQFPPMYLDWVGPDIPDPLFPGGSWHEIHPNHCAPWECLAWGDANPNGIFDVGDEVFILNPDTGNQFWARVDGFSSDIEIVREDPPEPPRMWLGGQGRSPFEPILDPLGPWLEEWPLFPQWWSCVDWMDNGNGFLDVCDYVSVLLPNGAPQWWHVEHVAVTVLFDDPLGALDWIGPVPSSGAEFDPIGPWHEIFPTPGTPWFCVEWHDDNGTGQVDWGDTLCFIDPAGGPDPICRPVADVFPDLELVLERPPCPCDCAFPPDGLVNIIDFLLLLTEWGGPGSCDADGNGIVNVNDFLLMLASWGPCP
jgi:hypothetical protein